MVYKLACFMWLVLLLSTQKLMAADWELTSLQRDNITSVIKTHRGIYAGELNSSSWETPYAGVYFSSDLGSTWVEAGLKARGVTGLSYDKVNKKLYASTYYSVLDPQTGQSYGGLFVEENDSWKHLGPKVSTAAILATPDLLLLGTNSHGLWASYDQGQTWTQKIGSGFFGPKFRVIAESGSDIFVHDEFNVYSSNDRGHTFAKIPYLKDEKISDIKGNGSVVLAGTSNNRGAFVSRDNGKTWAKVQEFEGKSIQKLSFFPVNNTFFAVVKAGTKTELLYSWDCETWNTTTFDSGPVTSIDWVFSEPAYLFIATSGYGVFKGPLQYSPQTTSQSFGVPWEQTTEAELVDTISAFFDHSYPLLGYSYYSEPESALGTTTNYLGKTRPEPYVYYSGHDGIDFALKYGTAIKAVEEGIAHYEYDNKGLGHHITIDHPNGTRTTYGHLQQTPANDFATPTYVPKGKVIGKVGLSGNTTGPHLHFSVLKDLNGDGTATNDVPQGKTDPFGWQNWRLPDPWARFSWLDALGQHTTGSNTYLWEQPKTVYSAFSGTTPTTHAGSELQVDVSMIDNLQVTTLISRIASHAITRSLNNLASLPNHAFDIGLYDLFGDKVSPTPQAVRLVFNYADTALLNFAENSLQVAHYDELTGLWQLLPTERDELTNTLEVLVSDFSDYAVVGKLKDTLPPIATAEVKGTKLGSTFIGETTVSLLAHDTDYASTVSAILVKLQDSDWQEYTTPLTFDADGTYTLEYTSLDEHGNVEQPKQVTFTINKELIKYKIRQRNANFTMQ